MYRSNFNVYHYASTMWLAYYNLSFSNCQPTKH